MIIKSSMVSPTKPAHEIKKPPNDDLDTSPGVSGLNSLPSYVTKKSIERPLIEGKNLLEKLLKLI
jgi:hypothetical protein